MLAQQPMYEFHVLGLLCCELLGNPPDLRILGRLAHRGEEGECALLAREHELQRMPRRHQVMRRAGVDLLRAFALTPSRNPVRMCDGVDAGLAREPANLIAVNAFRPREIAEYAGELRVVVHLHLRRKKLVALHRVGLDPIGDRVDSATSTRAGPMAGW